LLIEIVGNTFNMKLISKQENAVYFLKDNSTKEVLYGGAAQ
jgi:hypothetical protein